jgi:arylsulfatase
VATVPQVFDILADPQERYDIFMTTFTESTWALVPANDAISTLMKTYIKDPPRKLQSESYAGPLTLTQYQRLKYVQEELAKDGFSIGLPTGN